MNVGHRALRAVRKIVAGVCAVVGAATLSIAPVVAPSAAADPCPDVEVVFARGTAEPLGVGRVGQAASYNFLTTAAGATDATGHISSMAQECPLPAQAAGFVAGLL